jgi:hypothetical protein
MFCAWPHSSPYFFSYLPSLPVRVSSGSHCTCTTFCTTIVRKKNGKIRTCAEHTSVTSFPVTSLPVAPPPEMWLELSPYTTVTDPYDQFRQAGTRTKQCTGPLTTQPLTGIKM